MKIVIAGAGDVGFHLAKLLSTDNQEITLIDTNEEVLEYAQSHLDVFVIKGDSSSIEIMQNADVMNSKIFLAVTTSEKNNLVSCILAKKLGVKKTIARVNNSEYLSEKQRQNFRELGIDQLISPVELASQEIQRLVRFCEVTDNFQFEGGKLSLNGITLDDSSKMVHRTIGEVARDNPDFIFKPVAILRDNETIIPHADMLLKHKDHVYFLTPNDQMAPLLKFLGRELKKIKNIMILGGSPVGQRTAQLLEKSYHVSIVEKDKLICKILAENLNETLIIKGDPSNIDLLKEEGLDRMDAVIALTENSEINIIACLTAEKLGVYKTIALVDNAEYTHISQHIGVDTLINKKLIAANNIFRFVRKGKIEAITSLHGVDAEVIEYVIQKQNQLTRKPLKSLHFPQNSMIAAVIRDQESIIPEGDFQLKINDKVIVFAANSAIDRIDNLFR